jgi:hypothetical protein
MRQALANELGQINPPFPIIDSGPIVADITIASFALHPFRRLGELLRYRQLFAAVSGLA